MPREHNIIVTNTPDVLTEEVADIALGLLIATAARIHQGRSLSALRPLGDAELIRSASARCATARSGMVGMGRIGQAIGRRLEASRVPVVYHSRKPG